HVREFREQAEKEVLEPVRNLFNGDTSERMTAAVALAKVKMGDPTVSDLSLQEYFSQHLGYTDSAQFFEDVERFIPLQEELQVAQTGAGDPVESAPAGSTIEEKVAEEPPQPETGPVVTAEDSGLLAAMEEGRRVGSDPTATQAQRTAATETLQGELAQKHKRDTADKKRKLVTRTKTGAMIVGIPLAAAVVVIMMMLSLNSIGGGK
ncbi:MAG TPA: hypothetical protein VLF20_01870, partial [Patescibacteria group bacterium]|nr:hypothetical protein [Patescibacteria group bacterium]